LGLAQSVLIMATAIVNGHGLTRSSGSLKLTAKPLSMNCEVNGGMTIAASIALLVKAMAIWLNGRTLMSTSAMVSPSVSSILPTS